MLRLKILDSEKKAKNQYFLTWCHHDVSVMTDGTSAWTRLATNMTEIMAKDTSMHI